MVYGIKLLTPNDSTTLKDSTSEVIMAKQTRALRFNLHLADLS